MHAATDTDITACENCGTALHGAYCHACGQSAHNPLRNVAHALEEVFESFWHLDGRVFRTLRDLLVPGRVACNYLKGQRVRYIPPLRLFLVLTLLTFFVGHFTIPEDTGPAESVNVQIGPAPSGSSAFRDAKTEAEVQATLDRGLAELARARKEAGTVPLMGAAMDAGERALRAEAEARRAQLRRAAPKAVAAAATTPPASAATGSAPAVVAPSKPRTRDGKTGVEVIDTVVRKIDSARLKDRSKPWAEKANPADFGSLPDFADRWLNHRLANTAANIDRMQADDGKSVMVNLMMAAIPSALFVMVPVFALLLRVFYLFSRRSWLEHLVVALYSHAYLLLTLFATFVFVLLPLSNGLTSLINALLWIWAAIYLLLMQRRVYAQHWALTVLKFFAVGFLYQFLITGAMLYIVFAGISSGA
ncbi:DUF3667 domain-containing protein [Lysobacter xanthus]